MGLIEFVVLATVLGVLVYLLTTYVPMPAAIKNVIVIAVVVVLILILVRGLIGDVQIPRLR